MNYDLPKSVPVGGTELKIRYDFRAILDIIEVLNDPDFTDVEKAELMIRIFYLEPERITDLQEAINQCFWFIRCGEEEEKRKLPRLMDWEQDFPVIVSAINRVYGKDVRGEKELHWWTFIAAYSEIGDCFFAQIVRIREKRKKGKKLDKEELAWYKQNRLKVDLKTRYTQAERELIKQIGGGNIG